MTRRGPSRTIYAAVLVVTALAVLLVAWFLSGWADVRARQREVRAEPARAAAAQGVALAHDLRGELGRLMTREVDRPYFHYQNLMHDPRAGGSLAVSPSPLANGPEDPLVLGYFQLDAAGRVSTPTINDDIPSLSDLDRLAEHRRFRDEVTRNFPRGTLIAEAAPPGQRVAPPPRQVRQSDAVQGARSNAPPLPTKVVQIDRSSYAQNSNANEAFWQQNAAPQQRAVPRDPDGNVEPARAPRRDNAEQAVTPDRADPAPPVPPAPPPAHPAPVQRLEPPSQLGTPAHRSPSPSRPPIRTPAPPPATEPPPITITIAPLEWRTLRYAGVPALVAVRHVETPDGGLAQGFVVDRSTVTSWLASRAGDAVAELRTGDEAVATEIAPGWHLAVTANPRAVAAAAGDAARIARGFVVRFVVVGIIAMLAAAGAVLLVSRAERLARERSQFAAAAAHELRTPLAGLQLYGDMLADGLGDPGKLRDYARRMSEEASRLGRVVSNVLGFSQLERGNLSVEARRGNLGEALCELAERAQPALDRAGAALELDLPPDLAARFDRDALARIVGNLLDNAEKYGRAADDRTIRLAARQVADHVEVSVTDHGPGVGLAARSKLFRAFSRGVTSDGPAGLGLGLALSQSLARAMGGDLEYRPGDHQGATFILHLQPGTGAR